MKRYLTIILALSSAFVIYGGYYFGLPYLLNKPKFGNFIENEVAAKTGYKINFVNPYFKTGIIPSVIVKADEFSILNSDGTKALEITNPYTKIRLLPLIIKKVEICNFDADNLSANLVFDKNSQFRLGDYLLLKRDKQSVVLTKATMHVKKYSVNLKDEVQNKTLKLLGDELFVKDYSKDERISLSTSSRLYTGKKVSEIDADVDINLPIKKISEDKAKLNINVKDLDLSDFTVYANSLSNNKIKSLSGIINLITVTKMQDGHKNITGSLSIDKLGIMQKDKASSIFCDYPLKITGDANIIDEGVRINNLKVLSKNIDFFIDGHVYKTNAKFPILDLSATINHLRGENIIPLFPGEENLNPDFNFYKLKQHVIYGSATGHLDIKGEADYPNLYGNVLLSDVYLVEPIKDAPKNGVLKLSFDKHQMTLDAHVLTSPSEFVDVKGKFKLFRDRYTDLYITSTKNVDLTKAKKVLMPLREIFKFELGPIPMMNIDAGFGNANLHISGSKQDPHAWGEVSFRNGIASFITINNMVAKNIAGRVKFDDENVTFKTSSAYLNNLPVNIDGTCTMDGDLSVNVKGDGQNSKDLLKIINTSPILAELQEMLEPITTANGKTKIFLNIFGHVDRGVEPVFNKDLFAKGSVELISNTMTFFKPKIPASSISGIVNFNKNDGDFNIDANLINSPISANGVIKNNIITTNAFSNKFNAGDGLKIAQLLYGTKKVPTLPGINTISTSFSGHYQGPVDLKQLDYKKITAKGKIYNNRGSKSSIIVNDSDFEIKNGNLKLSQIRGVIKGNPYNLQLDASDILTEKQRVNGSFSMRDFDISVLNGIKIPEIPQLDDFDRFQGKINIASKIRNNNILVFAQLGDTSCVYRPKHIKISILNGNALFDTDDLNLNKINAYVGEMPVFINGKIKNLSKTPDVNLYVNAKPSQEFFDQFFNSKSVYPIKLKGDVLVMSKLNGLINKLNAKTELKLDENSSLYYMGATIGDLANPVRIFVDSVTSPDKLKLNNFVYEKIIASQNGKQFPNTQLTANGEVQFLENNNLKFRNFRVKTENPTDAKIFNIIFKKPFMKQGVFTSNLLINGDMYTPKILGTLDVTSIDVPIVDMTVKDISLDFKPDNIYIKTKSSVLDSSILLEAVMQNKLVQPFVFNDIKLHFENLDFNRISEAMQEYDATLYKQNLGVDENAKTFDPRQIIIKKSEITADKIKIRELNATNFKSDLSINNKMLATVKKYSFDLADGRVEGNADFNLLNNRMNLNSHIENSNAQTIAESLFNLKGQFYGIVNGDMHFNCNGQNQNKCMETLSGNGDFVIADGRMPKLGSLEYLLKASNLVSGGITGLSINGIIDLITPLKTGEFKSITGHYLIDNGIVKDLEVFSKGKDLNIYLTGSYNIENYIADMEVYGSLSSNITSVFGRLKNLSLNTLLNTIPLLNNNERSPEITAKINKIPNDEHTSISRIFAVDINGDINGVNYVKSFKWVK